MPRNPHVLLPAVVLLGCGAGTGPALTSQSDDMVVANGESLNGESLNGESLNGESLNGNALGSSLVGVSFNGVNLKGDVALDSAWLDGTVFYGTSSGAVFSGTDFKNAQFVATSDSGAAVPLRVDRIKQERWPDDDVWEYSVSFFDGSHGDDGNHGDDGSHRNGNHGDDRGSDSWRPLCVDSAGNPVAAIPVNGRWSHDRGVPGGGAKIADPSSFTFACMGLGAIAKCVFPIGYKPWKSVNGDSLDRWHQACVRLIRADFCGDGTPYTYNGQRVNLYDGIGVQPDSRNWLIEAEWDEKGARCFNPLNRSHRLLVPCFNDRALAACGAPFDFQLGALLMNETPLPVPVPLPVPLPILF